jgi:hypothetical protein
VEGVIAVAVKLGIVHIVLSLRAYMQIVLFFSFSLSIKYIL